MEKIRGLKKYILKAIKLLIILLSNFGRDQKIFNNLLIWINIQQGKNAPVNNEMEVGFVSRFLDLDRDLLIVDIGGHKGSYTDELLKNFSNVKIIIFEPSKSNCEILVEKYKEKQKLKKDFKKQKDFLNHKI